MVKAEHKTLAYSHCPRRRRRLAVWTAFTAILCSAIGIWYGQRQLPNLERCYWVYRCCHYVGAHNKVASGPNEYWRKLSNYGDSAQNNNVFCHEITASNGVRRLVILDADLSSRRESPLVPLNVAPTHSVSFSCWSWDSKLLRRDGDWNSASWSALIGLWTIGDGWRCDILHGELDPVDESHFWFRYELDDKSGLIDGWLCDDGSVKLKIRNGPAVSY